MRVVAQADSDTPGNTATTSRMPSIRPDALYVGGTDDAIIEAAGSRVGMALCWKMGASGPRLGCGRVDLILAGST